MKKKEIIKEIEKEAGKYFDMASGCHDWSHVERVRKLALNIGKKEKANMLVVEIAALLHDIGRYEEMKRSKEGGQKSDYCHAREGAKIAKVILEKYNFDKDMIENVVHCVESHRSRNSLIPKSIEAKVLYDADKIDGIGAVGIGRIFLFAGSHGSRNLYTGNEKRLAKSGKDYSYTKEDSAALEFEVKLKYTLKKIMTKSGKKMAEKRLKFMDEFFDNFWKEIEGKK